MANISNVYLLNTPLEDDMKNTLYFANASAQQSYMSNNVIKSYTNVSYQRDTSTFRCPAQIDTIRNCNYIMFQNTAYSNKWFYGFIKKMTYVNDNFTDVEFAVDPLQTFMFDITVRPSFIEREHTNDDTVGANLVPEAVEHGEYIMNGDPERFGQTLGETYWFVINADKAPSTGSNKDTSTYYSVNVGGVPMSGGLFICKNMPTLTNAFLTYSNMKGGLDHVKNVYIASNKVINDDNITMGQFDQDEFAYYKYNGTSTPNTADKIISRPSSINGYTPRNAKLLTAPFQHMLISNNNGSSNVLNYEYFSDPTSITIRFKGVPSVGGSIYYYPVNYKGVTENYNEGLIAGKFPTLSWSGDAWTNWLTQNSVNIGYGVANDIIGSTTGLLGSIATANPIAGIQNIVGGVKGVTDTLVEMYQHSIIPNTFSGNINGGDVITCSKNNELMIYKVSITAQFAQIIDDYLDMYGYATHRVKTPNKAHRQNWWYTKTIDANITGNVPNDYMNQIKGAYNNGITFWRNPSNFLDYSVSNGIV